MMFDEAIAALRFHLRNPGRLTASDMAALQRLRIAIAKASEDLAKLDSEELEELDRLVQKLLAN
jgi:hypothetical protein